MVTYSIKDWDRHFENHETRKLKRKLEYVLVPNKHDGRSFRWLMAHPDGAAHLGIWLLLVELASKMPKRGILADESGPLTPADMAMMTGAPEAAFMAALKVLISPRIGWVSEEGVEVIEQPTLPGISRNLPESPGMPGDRGRSRDAFMNRTEQNRTEQYVAVVENTTVVAAAAAAPTPPIPISAPTTPPRILPVPEPDDSPDRCALARGLVDELMAEHPKPGNPAMAVAAVERLIAEAVDPVRFCASARRAHSAWRGYWESDPAAFRPMLHRWFADGDYRQAPSAGARASPERHPGLARLEALRAKWDAEAEEHGHDEQTRNQPATEPPVRAVRRA